MTSNSTIEVAAARRAASSAAPTPVSAAARAALGGQMFGDYRGKSLGELRNLLRCERELRREPAHQAAIRRVMRQEHGIDE